MDATVADFGEACDLCAWSDKDKSSLQLASSMGINPFHTSNVCGKIESVISPGVRKNQLAEVVRVLFSENSNQEQSDPLL